MRVPISVVLLASLASFCSNSNDAGALPDDTFVMTSSVNSPRPPQFLRNISAQTYSTVTSPAGLPESVRAALLTHLAVEREMAPAGGRFNDGCLLQPGLPRQQLVMAATNERYSVVHFVEGGFAASHRVLVFGHGADDDQATVVWSGMTISHFGTRASFLDALHSGKLWSEASLLPGSPGA